MGEIISAVTMSHILMSPAGAHEAATRVFDGMMRIGRHVRASHPDVVVVISNDHMFNVGPGVSAGFLIGGAERFVPFGEMDIPREAFRGHSQFAAGFRELAVEHGMDVQRIDALRPDHGTAVPLLFADPDHDAAIVPLLVNHERERGVSPSDCWRLGELLGRYVASARPAGERVAIVGTGGLSHWVGYESRGVNESFDQEFLSSFVSGELEGWRGRSAGDIERVAGNGGVEIMNWLIAAAAVPRNGAELVFYEPIPSWMTGMGGTILRLSPRDVG